MPGKVSEEARRKTSETMERLWQGPRFRQEILTAQAQGRRPLSTEARQRLSEALMGHLVSEETRQSISSSLLGRTQGPRSEETKRLLSEDAKRRWKDPDYAQMMSEAQHRRPNESELHLQSILNRHFSGEWKYVGDGAFWVEGRNPDFLNTNSKKQVIEMFGMYWHDPDLFPHRPTEEDLIAHYKTYGFDCLILWEYDVWGEEQSVIEQIRNRQ